MVRAALLALGLAAAASPAAACRLALILALDVSASVDSREYALQQQGIAAALRDPGVQAAILAPGGAVHVAAYEWSGRYQQDMIQPWRAMRTAAEIETVARQIEEHRRSYAEFPTAIGYALAYGAQLMQRGPDCARKVIDISGDGLHNEGFPPRNAYAEFPFADITVNGLVIGGEDLELISFYQTRVAHGPDAFVEVAADYDDYARAMRRKLLREVLGDIVAAR